LGRKVWLLFYEHELDWATVVHVLAGVLAGILNMYSPLVALQLVVLFSVYQLIEAISNPEKDWQDVLEFTVGWFIGLSLIVVG